MWAAAVTIAMIVVQFTETSVSTLMKAAMSRGMSQFVYIVYSNAFALFFLIPSSFIFYWRRPRPHLTVSVMIRIFLLAILSLFIQVFLNTGIKYSSPTLAAALIDLTPAFTFLLAIVSRMEKIELKSQSSLAKSIGTIVLVAGALMMTVYKGLPITSFPSETSSSDISLLFTPSNWVVGGIFCSAGAFSLALLIVVQTWIINDYPAELLTTCIACIFVSILSTIVTLIAEKDLSVWKLKPDIELVAVVCSAIFAVSFRSVVQMWACHKRGPLYTSMFTPLGMIIATLLGVSFLGDTLYVGSVIGGIIIAIGFYSVLWGKAQELMIANHEGEFSSEPLSSNRVPILQNKSVDV